MFSIQIKKRYQNYDWVNAYIGDGDLAVGKGIVDAVVAAERAMHLDCVEFVNAHVAVAPQVTPPQFSNIAQSGTGGRALSTNLPCSPEDCAFVTFETVDGRPGKKFYRYLFYNTEIRGSGDDGQIVSNFLTTVATQAQNIVLAFQSGGSDLLVGKYFRSTTGSVRVSYGSCDTHHGWYNRATNP